MSSHQRRHGLVIRTSCLAAVSVLTLALVTSLGAVAASAKTATLHLYEKSSLVFYQPNGQPMTSVAFVPGDYFRETDVDYVGNDKDHAKVSTVSGNLTCTFTSSSLEAECNADLALHGSKLLSDHVSVNFAAVPIVLAINGGTGVFKHARGSSTRTCVQSCNATAPSWTSYFDDTYRYTT